MDRVDRPAESNPSFASLRFPEVEATDLPSESTEREIGPNGGPLLALARAVDALIAAGLVAQARPLVRQLVMSLEDAAGLPASSSGR